MDNKQQTDSPTPFHDQVNVNLFFSGAQRRKMLDEVKKAIAEGAAVITITGDEGVGKTMICRMLEKELPSHSHCVYLPNTLESFDDVVRVLALEVGTDNADKPVSSKVLVDEIAGDLAIHERRLVVLFDQAERMYLATIERIRKMLDKINSEEVLLQIVFAGRRSLLENLEQLAICNFEDAEEKHFSLNPLGLSETYAYLNHCGQQRSSSRSRNVFTPEAAKKIYSMAQGNLRMTNMLAAKSLETAGADTSVTVLLDNVDEERLGQPAASRKMPKKSFSLPPFPWLALAGVSLVLLLWLLVFRGEDDRVAEVAPPAAEKSDRIVSVEKDVTGDLAAQKPAKEFGTAGSMDDEPSDTSLASDERTGNTQEPQHSGETTNRKASGTESVKSENVATVSPPEDEAHSAALTLTDERGAAETTGRQSIQKPPVPSEDPPAEVSQKGLEKQPAEDKVTAIPRSAEKKIKDTQVSVAPLTVTQTGETSSGGDEPPEEGGASNTERGSTVETVETVETTGAVAPSATAGQEIAEPSSEDPFEEEVDSGEYGEPVVFVGMKKHLPPPEADDEGAKKINTIAPAKVKIAKTRDDSEAEPGPVDELFAERLAAGERWLDGKNQASHTIQLMVLTAEQAEENLKRRLQQKEYREVADKLYIVKGNHSRVYVFFGEYSDTETARQARNTLPEFLRKHAPYAVSIEEAIKKATAEP